MDKEQTVETLGYMLADLERKYAELEEENERLSDKLEWDASWQMIREPAQDEFGLPVPRLEIRAYIKEGAYEFKWCYNLVYKHLCDHLLQVPMGVTKVGGGRGPQASHGKIDEPYRESAHIRSEMKELGLPGFIICGNYAVEINSDNRDQKPWNPATT